MNAPVVSRFFLLSLCAPLIRLICSTRFFCCSTIHSSKDPNSSFKIALEASSIFSLTLSLRSLIYLLGFVPSRSALVTRTSLESEANWSNRSLKDGVKIYPSSYSGSSTLAGLGCLVICLILRAIIQYKYNSKYIPKKHLICYTTNNLLHIHINLYSLFIASINQQKREHHVCLF